MTDVCVYKIKVRGSQAACEAMMRTMPLYIGEKEILNCHGTPENYSLTFRGTCQWSIDAYTKPAAEKRILTIEEVMALSDEFSMTTLMDKSFVLECDIQCNSKNPNSPQWAEYIHFNKGQELKTLCPKDLRIKKGRDY